MSHNKAVIGTVKLCTANTPPADAWVDHQITLAKRLVLNGPKQGRDEYRQVLEREWEELRPRYRACWEAAQAALAEHAATVAAAMRVPQPEDDGVICQGCLDGYHGGNRDDTERALRNGFCGTAIQPQDRDDPEYMAVYRSGQAWFRRAMLAELEMQRAAEGVVP